MLDLWVRIFEKNKNYNLPKWQNKTQRKVIKAEKYQLLYSVVIFVNFVSNFSFKKRYLFSTNEAQKKSLIHLTSKKKCFLLIKNCGIMKPCKNSAFFLDVFLYKLSAEFQPFCAKNQGGEIVV